MDGVELEARQAHALAILAGWSSQGTIKFGTSATLISLYKTQYAAAMDLESLKTWRAASLTHWEPSDTPEKKRRGIKERIVGSIEIEEKTV